MTITILTFNILFIIFTLPSAIVSAYFYQTLIRTKIGSIIIQALDDITFSFHAFGFIFLFVSNKIFYKEVKCILFRENRSLNTSVTQAKSTINNITKY